MNRKTYVFSKMIYLLVAYTLIVGMIATTTIYDDIPLVSFIFGKSVVIARVILIILEIILRMKRGVSLKHCMGILILTVLTCILYINTGLWTLFDLFFIPLCFSFLLDYDNIMNLYYKIITYGTIIIIGLNIIGILPDYQYERSTGSIRYTFGFKHPNMFGLMIMIISILYILKAKKKLTNKVAIFCFFMAMFALVFPDSQAATICILIMGIGIIFTNVGFRKWINVIRKQKKLLLLGSILIFILLVCMVYLIAICGIGREYVANLSGTFYSRFRYGKMAIDQYGFSLFGRKIAMTGDRNIMMGEQLSNYFTLDCCYFYLPIVLGIIPTLYFGYWYLRCMKQCIVFKNIRMLGIYILLMLYSISEVNVATSIFSFMFIGAMCLNNSNTNNKKIRGGDTRL